MRKYRILAAILSYCLISNTILNTSASGYENTEIKEKVYVLEDFNSFSGINNAPKGWEITGTRDNNTNYVAAETIDDKNIAVSLVTKEQGKDLGIGKRFIQSISNNVVIDFRIKIKDLNAARFIEIKDSLNAGISLININEKGELSFSGSSTKVRLASNNWYRVIIAIDFSNPNAKAYKAWVDDNEVVSTGTLKDEKNITEMSYVRIREKALNSNGTSTILDDFRVYEGKLPKSLEQLQENNTNSSELDFNNELKIDISDRLKNSVAMVIDSNNALVNNNKIRINEDDKIKPIYKGNKVFVPAKFVIDSLGGKAEVNGGRISGEINKNQISISENEKQVGSKSYKIDGLTNAGQDLIVPADILTEALGKKLYTDYRGRGLVVIGDNPVPFDDKLDKADETIKPMDNEKFKIEQAIKNIIYDKPTGDKVMSDLEKNKGVHPRIIAKSEDFQRVKNLINSGDKFITKWYSDIKQDGDKNLKLPLPTPDLPDGRRMISSRQVGPLITNLAMLYRLSGDNNMKAKYKDRIWSEVEAVSKFDNWNEDKEFLNTAEFAEGLAIAYDWMYEFWTENERNVIRNAIIEKGLKPTLNAYKQNVWWTRTYPRANNWNAVCNGSMGMAVLAIGDENTDIELSKSEKVTMKEFGAKIIKTGFNAIEDYLLLEFTPDGAWPEGPGYWKYTLEYLVKYMAALESSVGTSYGHDKTPGLDRTAYFPTYLSGAVGSLNYGDAESNKIKSSEVLWIASKANDKVLSTIHLNNKLKNKFNGSELEMIWYRPNSYIDDSNINLDKHFRGTEVATMRSLWDDPNASFVGFKAGSNIVSHGHYDLGSFVYEALGQQWAIDLGKDDYNLPGYFNYENERTQYYRLNPEGHNTLVINPDGKPQQNIKAFSKIINFDSKPKGSFAIADLTEAYDKQVNSAKRGVMLTDNRSRFTVQDEVELKDKSNVWWFMHTKADIEVSSDGKSAILSKGGKKLWVGLNSDVNAKFQVMDAKPLPESPNPKKQNPNTGIRKLAINLSDVTKFRLTVNMVPVLDEGLAINQNIETRNLKDWSIEGGELTLPKLDELIVDGKKVNEFKQDKYTYNVRLPLDATNVPKVEAVSKTGDTIEIKEASDIPGTTKIIVSSKDNKNLKSIYYINFLLVPEDESKLNLKEYNIIDVTATAEQVDGNVNNNAKNSIDRNPKTFWAAEGDQSITYDLGEVKDICTVGIAFVKGNERIFRFDIQASQDGKDFNTIFTGESSGESSEIEKFYFKKQPARYVRIIGHGNSVNQWNSYSEVSIYGTPTVVKSITAPTAITGVPYGTAKTAAALGLPATVVMITNGKSVK